MLAIIIKIYHKLCRVIFWCLHTYYFKYLGHGAFLVRPFRIDGGDGIMINEGAFFQRGVWLYCCGIDGIKANLSVGKGCVFGYNNHITSVREVIIGDHVLTANGVYISDNLHEYEDINTPIMLQPVRFKRSVTIGSGAWIGENVSIIGANVGRNTVIGANSVVTRDIPDFCVAIGAPAVVVKQFDFSLRQWIATKEVS